MTFLFGIQHLPTLDGATTVAFDVEITGLQPTFGGMRLLQLATYGKPPVVIDCFQLGDDDWIELESKVKGDRRSPVKKLSWSFRVGAKIHGNPDIADIVYVGVRRSRLDFVPNPPPFVSNWGFEYRFDMAVDRLSVHGLRPARHVLLLDKKFLIPRAKFALTLKAGFIYTLADAYRGALATAGHREDFQFVLRPNVEF